MSPARLFLLYPASVAHPAPALPHVHIHKHAHTCTHAYRCVQAQVHTCTHIHVDTYMQAHALVCTHKHAHSCAHACRCVQAHLHTYTCGHLYAGSCTHSMHTRVHMRTHPVLTDRRLMANYLLATRPTSAHSGASLLQALTLPPWAATPARPLDLSCIPTAPFSPPLG